MDETGKLAQNVLPLKTDEMGQPIEMQADFFPQLEMALEDRDGVLVESKENRFFNVGADLDLNLLDWEGMIEVKHDSMLSPTPELERQRKLELYNLIAPAIAQIVLAIKTDVDTALALTKPVIQILESQNEKPKLWLPDEVVKAMEDPEAYKAQLLIQQQEQMMMEQQHIESKQKIMSDDIISKGPPLFVPAKGEAPKVVGEGQITNPVKDSMNEMLKVR